MSDDNQWISVKDRLPKKMGYAHLLVVGKRTDGTQYVSSANYREYTEPGRSRVGFCDEYGVSMTVTHWRELPEPPKE